MRKEPLLLPCAALASGILSGHILYFLLRDLYAALALACVALAFVLVRRGNRTTTLLITCAWFFLCGVVTETVHRQGKAPKLDADDGDVVVLSGCVTNPPVFSPNREQFTLNLTPRAAARLTLNLKDSGNVALDYGQRVDVTAKVRKPRNFQNPAAFDYEGYLAAQHIYWNGSVADPHDIRVVGGSCGSRAVGWLYHIRTWALERIRQLYPDDQHTIALLQATLLGETSGVDKRWTTDFRVTGTYHALVISGQHVSVLAFSLLLLLRLMRCRRVPALGIATIASWLYAFISGFSSPVVRGRRLHVVSGCELLFS